MTLTELDLAVRRLAFKQHAVFAARQVYDLGGTADFIERRLARGDWEQVEHGVYRLFGSIPTWRQKLMIAALAAGDGSAVSHEAAAALWGLPGFKEGPIEVLAVHGVKNHRLQRGAFHESRRLLPRHVTKIDGIPVTTIDRTLFDLAADIRPKRLERAVDNALTAGLTSPRRLWRTWGELAGRGRRGTRLMRAVLAERMPGYVAPASELEARFRDLLKAEGIPLPELQVDLGDQGWIGRVDCYFRPRIIVELDGRVGHVSELDRKRDRERDNELTAAGFVVIRFTWEELVLRPEWVLSILRGVLVSAA